MSFHEKSALACLLSIALIYVPYFVVVLRFPMSALGLFWIAAIGLAALLVAFHIVNAIATRSIRSTGETPPIDELDQKIELQAAKWAGLILAFAVLIWILGAMYSVLEMGSKMLEQGTANGKAPSSSGAIAMFAAMDAINWLFAGFVFANAAYYAGIVFHYRRFAGA